MKAAQLFSDRAGEPFGSFCTHKGELSRRSLQPVASFGHGPLSSIESRAKIGDLAELCLQPLPLCHCSVEAAPVFALDLLEHGQSGFDLLQSCRIRIQLVHVAAESSAHVGQFRIENLEPVRYL